MYDVLVLSTFLSAAVSTIFLKNKQRKFAESSITQHDIVDFVKI